MYLDWKDDTRDYYVIDIEADSLYPSLVWCLCWLNLKTGEKGECLSHDSVKAFFDATKGAVYIGHNILKYDAPSLVRLLNVRLSVGNCIDTLVLASLYSPNLGGGHSLEAWGERMGEPKGHFSDWSRLSPEMVTYCHQDVLVTAKLYLRLVKTLNSIGFSEKSCWIQHRFTVILERQRKNGFEFDGQRALQLYTTIRAKEADLEEQIRRVFPAERRLVAVRSYKRRDGEPTAIYLKDQARYILEPGEDEESYKAYEDIPFSIGSPQQRTEKLLELGWVPEEFTPKTEKGGGGNPKPFEKGVMSPSLERFLEGTPTPEVAMMAKWMAFNGRANMINTWLDNWDEEDGKIHGKLYLADTLRCRHQAPNTANIPAVRTDKTGAVLLHEAGYYTYEARDLWCARPGRVLVGTDAAGLELRMLAHYLNRPDFTKQVVEGDPHQYNADVVGITRPQAKTLIYAIMYGAAAPKIAKTLGVPIREGAKIRNMFLERLGLKELIDECISEQERGRVSLLDGSQVVCPSPHAALNYKLQGGGARVMAAASIDLERNIQRNGLDSLKVGDIHDEWQYDCDPRDADTHARLSVEAIRAAGVELSLTVPLDGEAKKGLTWAQTH